MDIHITTKDLRNITTKVFRNLVSWDQPIHHKTIILCLEALCSHFSSSYLDQSFFNILEIQGWSSVSNRSCQPAHGTMWRPSFDHPNIAIPIHVNGNHYVALTRKIVNGIIYFLYADDLNNKSTVEKIKRLLYQGKIYPLFCPPDSIWMNYKNYTSRPHSNECGPHTILALAVMMQHPSPHPNILLPYLEPNLAQCTRLWSAALLLTGEVHLQPAIPSYHSGPLIHRNTIPAVPHDLLPWSETREISTQTTGGNELFIIHDPHLTSAIRPPESVKHISKSPTEGGSNMSLSSLDSTEKSPGQWSSGWALIPNQMPTTRAISQNTETYPPITGHIGKLGVYITQPHETKVNNSCRAKWKTFLNPPTQQTLVDTLSLPDSTQTHSDIRGHTLHDINRSETFCIALKHPRSLRLFTDFLLTQYSFQICQSLAVGVLSLPETNVNWGHKEAHTRLHNLYRKAWDHSSFSTSLNKEDFKGINQPGRKDSIIMDNWS